jgi:hypothetical protein
VDEALQVHCPLYLLKSSEPCWKCGSTQVVHALGVHNLKDDGEDVVDAGDTSELILLSNIVEMPFTVFKYVAQRNHRYMKRYSRTAGEKYYANTCECGANFGDFYLFSEPGGAFFPDTDDAAREIELETTPFTGTLRFVASYSIGTGEQILQHARRPSAA